MEEHGIQAQPSSNRHLRFSLPTFGSHNNGLAIQPRMSRARTAFLNTSHYSMENGNQRAIFCAEFRPLGRSMKRKATNNECFFSPSRKQHITEEKMAACMQMLSLDTEQDYDIANPLKQENDDSDFEDDSDLEDDEVCQKRQPVVQFSSEFKEKLKRLEPILPKSILDNMCQRDTCLALVPYVPREEIILNMHGNLSTQPEVEQKNNVEENCVEQMNIEEMQCLSLDWDTDSENDLLLV